ncbi:UNVERIFIED_CONTAM: hypothetical protein PO322_21535, partial [Escherichia coli]
ADRNRSHWSTSKTPSYTKSVSWQHHRLNELIKPISKINKIAQNDFSCIHCRCAKFIYLFKK